MENHHREAIQKNYSILVQECKINELLPLLLQKGVFSELMINKYLEIPNEIKRKRQLFVDVETRGPSAFKNLVSSLLEIGQSGLANRLDPNVTVHMGPKKHTHPFLLPHKPEETFDTKQIHSLADNNGNANVNLKIQPLQIKVIHSTEFYDKNPIVPTYSTHSRNRGAVLIINIIQYMNNIHKERKAADIDSRSLNDLFTQMGLTVEVHVNLTSTEIVDVIDSFKSSPSIVNCDMVFIIVMGHGKVERDVEEVIAHDNVGVRTKQIEDQFDNRYCRALRNKPKIFMYQICRGEIPDYGTWHDNIETDSGIVRQSKVMLMRSCSDMLIAHSTTPGTSSHRDIYLGSWYMSLFCEAMMTHAHNTHLEDIFKIIDNKLSKLRSGTRSMQTSMYYNIGFKKCYLHPGIYLEGNEIKCIHGDVLPQNQSIATD